MLVTNDKQEILRAIALNSSPLFNQVKQLQMFKSSSIIRKERKN
jgi:hypothetical protein